MDIKQRIPLFEEQSPKLSWSRQSKRVYIDQELVGLENKHVYRYCSIPEAVKFLTRSSWSFSHPAQWRDKYESRLTKHLFMPGGPYAKYSVFAKCFSLEYGSDALWRLNSSNLGLLRLSFPLSSLLLALDESTSADTTAFVCRARYMRPKHFRAALLAAAAGPLSRASAASALSMKREGFYYENEIRVCAFSSAHAHVKYKDFSGFRPLPGTSVLLDPAIEKWQSNEITSFLNGLGIKCPISRSTFND